MARSNADLHVHTTHSDGTCSPGEVVRSAANVNLQAVAITDHDTISAIAIARPEAERCGIELVGGVELTAEWEAREVHVLGHFIREDSAAMIEACRDLRDRRDHRIHAMVDRLQTLGISVDLATLGRTFPRATIGRKHLAEWLLRTRQVANFRDAFTRYLGDDGPAQVPKPRLPFDQAIKLIRKAGGVAGLAHPPYDLRETTLDAMVAAGLGAIEVDGPGIGKVRGERLRRWADQFSLVPTAGTDFHAPDRPGRWVGAITTSTENLERLRQAAANPNSSPHPDLDR